MDIVLRIDGGRGRRAGALGHRLVDQPAVDLGFRGGEPDRAVADPDGADMGVARLAGLVDVVISERVVNTGIATAPEIVASSPSAVTFVSGRISSICLLQAAASSSRTGNNSLCVVFIFSFVHR